MSSVAVMVLSLPTRRCFFGQGTLFGAADSSRNPPYGTARKKRKGLGLWGRPLAGPVKGRPAACPTVVE